jgi:hypothetical protein
MSLDVRLLLRGTVGEVRGSTLSVLGSNRVLGSSLLLVRSRRLFRSCERLVSQPSGGGSFSSYCA